MPLHGRARDDRDRRHGPQARATVIAITDGPRSPLNTTTNLALYAFAAHRLLSSSAAAAFTLVEALISATAHQREDSLKRFTDLTEQVGHYLHGELPRAYAKDER